MSFPMTFGIPGDRGFFPAGGGFGRIMGKMGKMAKRMASSAMMSSGSFENAFGGSADDSFPMGSVEAVNGQNLSLKSVSIKGGVRGLLFSYVIKQEYRNEGKKPVEIIYTFPVGWQTALLGMKAKIGDRELEGEVVEKTEAEETYEEAIAKGDSAIMVQKSATGMYTANIGNIAPGENVTVEIHCAQLLKYDNGRIRLCIPTVIGERYGNSHAPGGLAPHEKVSTDANASYPFNIELTLDGDIASGEVKSPSHEISTARKSDGLHVWLADDAKLDRDFILLMAGRQNDSHAFYIEDDKKYMVAASFSPRMEDKKISPVALKILVDCSGSMSGGRIAQARKGLSRVLGLLQPDDYISYSCFGSDVRHLTKTMLSCKEDAVEQLSKAIDATKSDMGGTEMEGALKSVCDGIYCEQEMPSLILLVTDGDVWDVKNIIETANKSGHRIFAIGVGSAPGESLLREMAEKTGGACEFVTENENMADALVRMFHKMRGSIVKDVEVNWNEKTLWQSKLPKYIYDGETVHVFALMEQAPQKSPVLSWLADGKPVSASAEKLEKTDCRDLMRMGRMRQLEECKNKKEKLEIALDYQLVSDVTSLVLVDERAEGEKLKGIPELRHVPQMRAHGHGVGGFLNASACCFAFFNRYSYDCMTDSLKSSYDMKQDVKEDRTAMLEFAVERWKARIASAGSCKEIMDSIMNEPYMRDVQAFLSGLAGRLSLDEVYAVFIFFALKHEKAERHVRRMARQVIESMDKAAMMDVYDAIKAWLNA